MHRRCAQQRSGDRAQGQADRQDRYQGQHQDSARRRRHRLRQGHAAAGADGYSSAHDDVQLPDLPQSPRGAVGDHARAAADVRRLPCPALFRHGLHHAARPRPKFTAWLAGGGSLRHSRRVRRRYRGRPAHAGRRLYHDHRLASGADPAARGGAARVPDRRRAMGAAQARAHQPARRLRRDQDLRHRRRRHRQGRAGHPQHDAGGARRGGGRGARLPQDLRGALLHAARPAHGAEGRRRHHRAHGVLRRRDHRHDQGEGHLGDADARAPHRSRDRNPQADRNVEIRHRQDEKAAAELLRHVPADAQGRNQHRDGHRHGLRSGNGNERLGTRHLCEARHAADARAADRDHQRRQGDQARQGSRQPGGRQARRHRGGRW